jgi:thiamine-phosphate pyrophosphorylase
MRLEVPHLYAIVDRDALDSRGIGVAEFARELRDAGVRLLQYRDKRGAPQQVLAAAAVIRRVFEGTGATLILNDRADLAVLAGWDGVHVGHLDMAPSAARRVFASGVRSAKFGSESPGPGHPMRGHAIIGVSTHNGTQVLEADAGAADYVAIGPVFATGSKADAEAVVGLEGVRRARSCTTKPLVGIGGITAANARSVMDAGADAVAVIGALLPAEGRTVREQVAAMMAACLS